MRAVHAFLAAAFLAGCACAGAGEIMDYTVQRGLIYSQPDGDPLHLNLYLPRDTRTPRPAVLLIHGGAWVFGTRGQLYYYGRHLAQNGYVAAAITYRLMPGHGFPSCLHDAKAAVRWLRLHAAEYNIDPERIGVIGNSAGGHLASLLAVTRPEDGLEGPDNPGPSSAVQAVVPLYGVADLSYYQNPSGYIELAGFTKAFMRRFVTMEQPGCADPYDRASPIAYTHPGCPPFLLVHGTRDGQVPHAQAVVFHQQLMREGVPAQLMTVPYGHAFDFFHPRMRERVFGEILAFFEKYL